MEIQLTYEEVNKYLGRIIRKDTYLFMMRMINGEDYATIRADLDANRKKYGINATVDLAKEATCFDYIRKLSEVYGPMSEEEEEEKDAEDWWNHKGIYGICADDKIIYVGSTIQSFKEIYKRHLTAFNHPKKDEQYLYRVMRNKKEAGCYIHLICLVDFDELELKNGQELRDRDINAMVLALIKVYNPAGNVSGRLAPFKL